jgi:hypothetical protein
MPSTTSSSFSSDLPSSTVITPSLPTLSMASAMILPIDSSSWQRSCRPEQFLCWWWWLCWLLQFFNQGGFNSFVDAALQVHGVHACGHVLHAFAHDGLGQNGGGGGAVASVVAGFEATSFTICAPMF